MDRSTKTGGTEGPGTPQHVQHPRQASRALPFQWSPWGPPQHTESPMFLHSRRYSEPMEFKSLRV